MFEAIQNSNLAKDALVEAKLADAQKHIKELNLKLDEMKIQINIIKAKSLQSSD